MDKLEFPVATCPYCKIRGPVIIESTDIMVAEFAEPVSTVDIIVCPECVKIINNDDKDIEVEWFSFDDAKYFGYKVVDDGTE